MGRFVADGVHVDSVECHDDNHCNVKSRCHGDGGMGVIEVTGHMQEGIERTMGQSTGQLLLGEPHIA